MEKFDILIYDETIADLYLQAILSGDPNNYDWDKESTHPYFNDSLKALSLDQLGQLQTILRYHIETLEKQTEKARGKVDWGKEVWDMKMSMDYFHSQNIRNDLERLWHLELRLQDWINERMNRVVARVSKNLGFDLESTLELRRKFNEDLIVILGAGWFGLQEQADA